MAMCIQVLAQSTVGGVSTKGTDLTPRPYGTVEEMDNYVPKISGSVYIEDLWLPGEIKLINGHEIRDQTIKFDLSADIMEIKVGNDIKALGGHMIREFFWTNPLKGEKELYVNSRLIKSENEAPLVGLFKVLNDGNVKLYGHVKLDELRPNYNKALALGERDSKLVKRHEYYIYKDDELIEMPKSKRKFAALFANQKQDVLDYLSSHNLSLKKEKDLVAIMKYINSSTIN